MAAKTSKWNMQDHLQAPDDMAHYLAAAFEDGDPALVAAALGDVVRSKNLSEIARRAGVSREALYKALTPEGDPKLSTFFGVVKALGLRVTIDPANAA